jgi:hypothetical protein
MMPEYIFNLDFDKIKYENQICHQNCHREGAARDDPVGAIS